MEKIDLSFNYTQAEHVKAERQYLFASKIISKASVVVLVIYLPVSFLYSIFSSFSILSVTALGIGFLASTLGCILYFFMPAYRFKKTAKYHERYTLRFSMDGITFKTSTINSELKWNIYSELWESNEFYFLIQAVRSYTLIPKRTFQNPSDQQIFEKMALTGLKCNKRIL